MTKRRYTEADLQYCKEHYGTDMTPAQCARHIGVSVVAIKAQVQIWRRKGHDITNINHKNTAEAGEERLRNINGRKVLFVKRADGKWRMKDGGGRGRKKMSNTEQYEVQRHQAKKKRAKAIHAIKDVDASLVDKLPLFIPELKMTVYVNSEEEKASMREKYLEQHKERLGLLKHVMY